MVCFIVITGMTRDPSLIFRHWFALKAPVMLLQHCSKLLNRESSKTVSWKQTYSSNLSFSWSDSRAAQSAID